MQRKTFLGALVAMLALAAVLYINRGGHAPTGQPQLQVLTAQNTADFKQAFNAAKDDARVLLLLSPT